LRIIGSGRNEQGDISEVTIDVLTRSVIKVEEVAWGYEHYLDLEKLEINQKRGDISYKLYDGILRIVARPETISVDAADGRIFPLRSVPPRLPHPQVVAGMCGVLQGSRSKGTFAGFRSTLPGRERGGGPVPTTVIPACVAWYVGGAGKLSNGPKRSAK
jgi:hypothetical protein